MEKKNNILVLYLDPSKLTKEEMIEQVNYQRKVFKNKDCNIEYHINEYGIYKVILTFSPRTRKGRQEENLRRKQEIQELKRQNEEIEKRQQQERLQRKLEIKRQKEELKRQNNEFKKQRKQQKQIEKEQKKQQIQFEKAQQKFEKLQKRKTFSEKLEKNEKIFKKDFKNFKSHCKILTIPRKEKVEVKKDKFETVRTNKYHMKYLLNFVKQEINNKRKYLMEKLNIYQIFKTSSIENIQEGDITNNLTQALNENEKYNNEKIEFSKIDFQYGEYKYINPFENEVSFEEKHDIEEKEKGGTNKFNLLNQFEKIIDNSIQKQYEKDELRKTELKNSENSNKLYGNYRQTKRFKPL